MADDRTIREGALQPAKDPASEPPGPKGTKALNPITGRPQETATTQTGQPKGNGG